MVEIVIVVAIIGLLAAMTLPSLMEARRRSMVSVCMSNMRQIEAAKSKRAADTVRAHGTPVTWNEVLPYLQGKPACPAGGQYEGWHSGTGIYCTEHDWRPQYQGRPLKHRELKGFHP